MRSSVLLTSALGAAAVVAAPVYPQLNLDAAAPGGLERMSDYFNMLALKVQAHRYMSEAPVCDLSRATLPAAAAAGLPPPSKGLVLKHVAVGRGTQNYTCDVKNATAAPVAVGAVATLFNASCVAASYPDLLDMLPGVSLQFNLTGDEVALRRLGPTNLAISGHHFFTNTTTPFFSLDTTDLKLGQAACSKNNTLAAPADSAQGQGGELAVPWLKLLTRSGATGDLQEVYRLDTAGGSAPATCAGMPASFEVQYSATYWFYEGPNAQASASTPPPVSAAPAPAASSAAPAPAPATPAAPAPASSSASSSAASSATSSAPIATP
jgi:hypothetical protein